MMKGRDPISIAQRVLAIEADAIRSVSGRLSGSLEQAVDLILKCEGKVIVTGMGKSGHVARKIAATLTSTGTPAFFVHPGEGLHGDLGVIAKNDIVLAISYSGNSSEVVGILPSVKHIGAPLIAMTGKLDSPLAEAAEVVLDVRVEEEACPLGLAPTASTTATLALGDALAVVLLERREFTEKDFARFHPGGSLGRRLIILVSDLMHKGDEVPRVPSGCIVSDAVVEMSSKRLGITGVFDSSDRLIGCLTDGDLRRGMQKYDNFFSRPADDIMTKNPKRVPAEMLAVEALRFMEQTRISAAFVTDEKDDTKIVGAVHMHDLLKAGLV
jgi:arabinose-5-phosphate isomerase